MVSLSSRGYPGLGTQILWKLLVYLSSRGFQGSGKQTNKTMRWTCLLEVSRFRYTRGYPGLGKTLLCTRPSLFRFSYIIVWLSKKELINIFLWVKPTNKTRYWWLVSVNVKWVEFSNTFSPFKKKYTVFRQFRGYDEPSKNNIK